MTDSQLPEPTVVEVDDVTTAVIAAVVPMPDIAAFFDSTFSTIGPVLAGQGVTPVGPAFAAYHGAPGEEADLEAGFPIGAPLRGVGDVQPSVLPAGRVARVVHAGGYDGLGEAWGRLQGWIGSQGLTPGELLYEVYVTEPTPDMDPATLRTELNWYLAD
jgi:effector-binding domain-containing protein